MIRSGSTLALVFLCSLLAAQPTKPVIINEYEGESNGTTNRVGSQNSFRNTRVLTSSCWNDLDANYSNINSSLFGDESYSSYYPLDDGSYGPINLGWNFTFYGVTYNSLYVNVNGNVTFGDLYSAYSARGFPSSSVPAMIAPFWADVDLRGSGVGANKIYVKLESNKITIQWVGVGYYNQKTNLTNTFQLVLTDGTDPEIGIGYNTRFAYGDMNWCVGDASGGSGGFGSSVYATVGAQSSSGADFYQIGLFGRDNSNYDGAGGALDGVHYLDGRCFTMNLQSENIPPIANDLPASREINICPGTTYSLSSSYSSPENDQNTITTITNTTLSNFSAASNPGNLSTQTVTLTASAADIGTHYLYYTATDNGIPAAVTYDTITVNVYDCSSADDPSSFYLDGENDYAEVQNHDALYSGGSGTYSTWVYPESTSENGEIAFFSKEDQYFLGMVGSTLIPRFKASIGGTWQVIDGVTPMTVNQWHHVTATVTGTQIKIYLDGNLETTTSVSGQVDISNKNLFIGTTSDKNTYFKGKVDQISLWSRDHSDQEVDALRWELGTVENDYLRAHFKCTNNVLLVNEQSTYHGSLFNVDLNSCWKANYASVWDGSEDGTFSNKDNWEEGLVPDPVGSGSLEPDNYVIIPEKAVEANALIIDGLVEANNMVFKQGAEAVIQIGGTLKLYKNLYNYSGVDHQGGVTFSGIANQGIHGQNIFNDLTIDGNVVMQDDQNIKGVLTLNTGALIVNDKELTIVSDAESTGQIFHNSGQITGEVNMQRYLPVDENALGWHYLGPSLLGMEFSELNNAFPLQGLGNTFSQIPHPNVYTYNETVVDPNKIMGWESPSSLDDKLESLQGYIIHHPSKNPLTLNLKGTVNSGTLNRVLTHTPSSNTYADGWNLLGNPYPSALDWDLVEIPSNMDNALYVYDSKNDQYTSYVNGTGANGGTNQVPTMQGFFVKANATTSFQMTNDARIAGDNSNYLRTTGDLSSQVIKIKVQGTQISDETAIKFDDNATNDFDSRFDAWKLFGSVNKLNIYTKIGEKKISINSMPSPQDELRIPLYLEIAEQGNYDLNMSASLGFGDQKVYLEDLQQDSLHDLTTNGTYSFYNNQPNNERVLTLRVAPDNNSLTNIGSGVKTPIVTVVNGKLYLSNIQGQVRVEVHEMTGKLLWTDRLLSSSNQTVVPLSGLNTGCYVIKCTGAFGVSTKKVIIK